MGKIIKDGFTFVAYANAGLIRKVDDIPELKHVLVAQSEEKTHRQMAEYAILLGAHILDVSGIPPTPTIEACLEVNRRWLAGEIPFRAALNAAGAANDLARAEKDPMTTKVLRAMGQVAATPHVRWHPLVASEYAVVAVNLLHPGSLAKAREERECQIELLQSV